MVLETSLKYNLLNPLEVKGSSETYIKEILKVVLGCKQGMTIDSVLLSHAAIT